MPGKKGTSKAAPVTGLAATAGRYWRWIKSNSLDLWAGATTVGWVLGQIFGPILRFSGRNLWALLSNTGLWRRVSYHGSSVAFVAAIALLFGLFSLTRSYTPPADADLWTINRPPSVTMLDRSGEEIGIRGSQYDDPVPLEDLPPYVVAAFLSTEDRRFYRHNGFDLRGFIRAMVTNLRSGSFREGASTITQQLARNLFLSNERSLERKLQELNLAFWLETRYSKDELLSLYLNRTYLGAGTFGIDAAAQLYFNKSARDLTLPEAALLAGLPKAPSTLSPTVNFEGAAKRSLEVIDNLVETRVIDRTTAEIAKTTPPELDIQTAYNDFGYFFDYVYELADALVEGIESDIVITTTIDSSLQQKAQAAVTATLTEENLALGAEQAALIAYDNDGAITAMVGGRSYEESQFNRATQARRQPGSAFKPFVYLAALEGGMTPRTLFIDQPTEVEEWKPRNYTNEFLGPMRMTEAMARSVNSVAVQASETVGRKNVVEAARRNGITSDLKAHPSVALGSMEVTLEEITSAYLPFARKGLSATPYAILKIENRENEILYEHEPSPQTQLFKENVSADMTHLMHQVMLNGTGSRANLGRRDAAGKTGTTNDWRDAWFIGYTAQITAGIWVGNDLNTPMDKITGGSLPAAIWRNFMLAAHEDVTNVALPGAFAATGSEELRLIEFYNGLQEDFRGARYAEAGGRRSNDPYAYNERVEQVEGYTAREEELERQRREQRRRERRRWWIFGGRD